MRPVSGRNHWPADTDGSVGYLIKAGADSQILVVRI